MDLYDDLDTKQRAGQIDGWSSGIKLLQTQLALKKATIPTPARKDFIKRPKILPPVMMPKYKKDNDINDIFQSEQNKSSVVSIPLSLSSSNSSTLSASAASLSSTSSSSIITTTINSAPILTPSSQVFNNYDWDVVDEYDPLWPNEYEKLVKDKRDKDHDKNDRNNIGGRGGGGGGGNNNRDKRRNTRFEMNSSSSPQHQQKFSGFGGRPDDEDTYSRSPPSSSSASSASASTSSTSRTGGAAIAPPSSLQENSNNSSSSSSNVTIPYGTNSVAAKIMAKYGFKDGQGLGKQEQGMSIALQVEKTSKRGGRIIHEKEFLMPAAPADSPPPPQLPSVLPLAPPPSPAALSLPVVSTSSINTSTTMPIVSAPPVTSKSGSGNSTGGGGGGGNNVTVSGEEPTITEIMKTPSKVVLLRNMVGPGDVDNDLEPEVKDECNTKYGDVISVIINELQNVQPEEAVRIFVEFKRIESAIKAVVDLNGRFFGGRQVKAGFFSYDKYKAYQLYD